MRNLKQNVQQCLGDEICYAQSTVLLFAAVSHLMGTDLSGNNLPQLVEDIVGRICGS